MRSAFEFIRMKTADIFFVHYYCLLVILFNFVSGGLSLSPTSTTARKIMQASILRTSSRARLSNQWLRSNKSARPLWASADSNQEDAIEKKLQALEQQMAALNNGSPLNANSSKQVSQAVFGTIQSASRIVLQQVVSTETFDPQRRQLASLVLEYRNLSGRRTTTSKNGLAGSSTAPFSTVSRPSNPLSEDDILLEEVASSGEVTSNPSFQQQQNDGGDLSSYEAVLQSLFHDKSQISDFWRDSLAHVTKPSARNIVWQLHDACPMGYDPTAVPNDPLRSAGQMASLPPTSSTAGKKGSLLAYIRDQKDKYSDCIVLTRVGDFYETFGVDAVMLMEHCGLNAMAGKARAGCPIRNIQATLDCLTARGFRVAVYEEASDTDASPATGKTGASPRSRLKSRMLAQIVSTASPTYLYDLILQGNADTLVTSPPSRPHVGIISTAAGYTFVEVSTEERSVQVLERLTAEAVACRLTAYPPADPLIFVPPTSAGSNDASRNLPFLPSRSDAAREGVGSRLRTRVVPPSLLQEPQAGLCEMERARNIVVGSLLQLIEREYDSKSSVSVDDFVLVSSTVQDGSATYTNPLYVETATQLGLMHDKTIPPLVEYLLPDSAPAANRRFLRRWLLTPPAPMVTDAMALLVSSLKSNGPSIPPMSVPPVGKVLSLLRAGQASAQVYGELLAAMHTTITVLDMADGALKQSDIVEPLMTILKHESGIAAEPDSLRSRCMEAMSVIEDVVSPIHHVVGREMGNAKEDRISDFGDLIPRAFFERNEAAWRGRVRSSAASASYQAVECSANRLAQAVARDFWGMEEDTSLQKKIAKAKSNKSPIVQDIFNNIFALKAIPDWAKDANLETKYFHPKDRNNKLLRNRYTTPDVQSALAEYVAACDGACDEVTQVLTQLSQTLCDSGHLPAIVQAAHSNLILSTAFNHAAKANSLGWTMASVYDDSSSSALLSAGHFEKIWPYWMDRSAAVSNSFNVDGMFLLTAPNMSGKSTLMRSTAAVALLSNCGLCAPCGPGSVVRRFDNLFVRGASADVPTEEKSAFGAEMGDVAALLRSCGSKSLVFVDELGRGTSPKDGTCLAGAVLEAMADAGMCGVFATHLHSVLDLPLRRRDRIKMKRMAIMEQTAENGEADYKWTYRLEEGVCTDSLALVTAARFGLPKDILERAAGFATIYSEPDTTASPSNMELNTTSLALVDLHNGQQPIDLSKAQQIAEELTGQLGQIIPPSWHAPPSLEGRSCVYILELEESPPRYYVGETESIQRRLSQHRAKGGAWSSLAAVAIPVTGGKTHARNMESLVIQKLAKAGFQLESTSDGRSIRGVGLN